MSRKPVAVIILNWNGERLLREYLPSIIANNPDSIADVIVADNGSADGSLALLAEEFPQVRTLAFGENLGFAEGYNRAIRETEAEYGYTVLLNSDVRADSDWLTLLYRFMLDHPEAGACQPKLLADSDRLRFEYAGASGGYLDRHGYPYCRGRIFDTVEEDCGQYDTPAEVHWASGACLMVDNSVYTRAGGLDPAFFAHMEEIDLCWRIRLLGRQVWAVPAAHVYHLGGGSLPASDPRKTYLNFRNNLLMLHKNLPDSVRTGILLRRRLLDTAAWAKFVASGDFAQAKAVWRAHRDFASMRSRYKEHPKQNLLNVGTNIIFDYYIRARHTYSSLEN